MDLLVISIALLTFCYLIFTTIEMLIGDKQVKNLNKEIILPTEKLPFISIIFSALNEEEVIAETIKHLMQLDYPHYEVIAINDRSTDQTAIVLQQMQQQYPLLRVHHIKELPPGWIGKNYALHEGSQLARGDWLLFTDADVLMQKNTLSKSISYALRHHLKHLTIWEQHIRHTFWLKVMLQANYLVYLTALKPWRMRHAKSKCALGYGAFNLVEKAAYQQCKGHLAIALQCLDDMCLAKLFKAHHYRQDIVNGDGLIKREWYATAREMIHGMKKNAFAYYDFKLLPMIRDSIFAILFFVWPIVAVLFFSGTVRLINIANVFLMLFISFYTAKKFQVEKLFVVMYPISYLMMIYTLCYSTVATYKNQGVIWRGTHYPLKILRDKK